MATYAELIPAYEPSADADADNTGSSEPSITPELEERLAEQSMLNSMLFDLLHRHADLMNEDMRQRESGNQTEAMRIENERELGAMQAQIDEAQQRLRLINRELEEAGIGR